MKENKMISVPVQTEFIKLESAMKYVNATESGGMAKSVIQEGLVTVNDEACTMRGKKLYPGDRFTFMGTEYVITIHS